jgi:L-threonylcarbamoyladenylate synthase
MRTLVLDPTLPDAAIVREAAGVLRAGGLVAFPTETVYGLGARVFEERALAKIYAAKGRPANHPLIAHVLGELDAARLCAEWPERASRLARAFWPGPLTLVLTRAPGVPAAVSGGGDSIAVRAPANPVARALLSELAEAIAAPSANRYQGISPTTAEHVARGLGDRVDLILDGGPCARGIESTVVDLRGEVLRVLRPGAIDLPALRAVEPGVVLQGETPDAGAARASPGMDARHYAPRAQMVVARGRAEALEEVRTRVAAGERVGLVLRGELGETLVSVVMRTLGEEPEAYERQLYAALHALDAARVDVIVVEPVPEGERWAAVADRLRRGGNA